MNAHDPRFESADDYLSRRVNTVVTQAVYTLEEAASTANIRLAAREALVLLRDEAARRIALEDAR